MNESSENCGRGKINILCKTTETALRKTPSNRMSDENSVETNKENCVEISEDNMKVFEFNNAYKSKNENKSRNRVEKNTSKIQFADDEGQVVSVTEKIANRIHLENHDEKNGENEYKEKGSDQISKYLFANIRGLKHANNNKIPFIEGLLNESGALFAAFTETHSKKCLDSELWVDGYNLFRSERNVRECGGCCLYTHDSLICTEILKSSNDMVELLIVKIENMDLIIIVIYRPPDTFLQKFQEQLRKVEVFLKSVKTPSPNILLLGDFNFSHLKWENQEGQAKICQVTGATNDVKSQLHLLFSLCNDYYLNQFVWEKTREKNTLDLIFTNNEALVHHMEVTPTIFSDHHLIEVTSRLGMPLSKKLQINAKDGFSVFNFNKSDIDWDAINHSLMKTDWKRISENKDETMFLKEIMETAMRLCNSRIKKRNKKRPKTARYVRLLYKRRRLITNRLAANRIRLQHKRKIEEELKEIENKLKYHYKSEAEEEEKKAIDKLKSNPRFFYSFAKKKQRSQTGIGPLKRKDGSFTDSPEEMADLLNEQYESVFSKPKSEFKILNPDVFFFSEISTGPKITDIELTPEDFIKAIDEMPLQCAPGPDTWNSVFIKKCKTSLALPFSILWRKSLDSGLIPDDLLFTDIAPLHKGSSKALPKNYRPIALTSHVIKIFERVLRRKLMDYIEKNKMYNPGQHGFRPGRSCLSQLLDHFDKVLVGMENRNNLDVIYTDFAKAFDKCDHGIIAHKLKKLGITGKVGRWIFYFLSHRVQRVVVDGFKSNPTKVMSSVPQGTVLAPILFLILISDIDKNVEHSFMSSFADDTRIGKIISSVEDSRLLQEDLNRVFIWAEENNMEFNEEKFQLLRYGNNQDIKLHTKYETKSEKEIERSGEVRDLGVIMSDNINFESHNQNKINEIRRLSGWILRVFKTREPSPMLTLFKSLILPRIEYCCILTSPYKIGEIADIEGIQRSFTAQITSVKHLDYWKRLKHLNMYSLERRRERYMIIYTWKILEGLVPNFVSNSSKITCQWSMRRGRLCKIPPLNHSGRIKTIRDNFLSVKGPRLFNTLPQTIRNIKGTSLSVFKRNLDDFLKRIPDEPSLPGYAQYREARSNSMVDQVPCYNRRAWAMPGPQETT